MNLITRVRAAVRGARFDPRLVLVGSVLLFLASLGGFGLAQTTANKADKVAAPVAMLCQRGGTTAMDLGTSGACGAADNARTAGPYVITKAGASGEPGANGADGTPGVNGVAGADSTVPGRTGERGAGGAAGTNGTDGGDGADGTNGTNGTDGAPGVDGVTPACVDEPGQCRGADGRDGINGVDGRDGTNGTNGTDGRDGAAGPPGPTCPPGSTLAPVMFASGQQGLGCVTDPAPADPDAPEPTE